MILTHPDNMARLKAVLPAVAIGDSPAIPVDAIEIRTDPFIEPTRKTGRLIWPDDPFVTYEESDRSWGLALGIAAEEVEPVFYEFTPPKPAYMDSTFVEFREEMNRKIIESFRIPQRILFGGFA